MLLIDSFSYQSRLRYINTGEKFFLSILTLCLCVAGRCIRLDLYIILVMAALTVLAGGLSPVSYFRLFLIPLSFLAMNALVLGLSLRETPLELFSLPVGGLYLTAGRETLSAAACMAATALAGVSCLYFLALSTPLSELLLFLKGLHLPALIIELMMLIYRFIFLLLDCAGKISVAQRSRLGNRDFHTSLSSFASLVSCLFIQSVRRSGILYDAMESRCYDGNFSVLRECLPPKPSHLVLIAAFEASACLVLWLAS